jgi:hypothetical protein
MKIALSSVLIASAFSPVFSLSYLDSIAKPSTAAPPSRGAVWTPSAVSSGSGMSSYADSLKTVSITPSAPVAPAAPAFVPAATPNKSTSHSGAATTSGGYLNAITKINASTAPTGGGITGASANYLTAVASMASSGAPTGAGITQYLDAVPRTPSVVGGAGIKSYAAALAPESATGRPSSSAGGKEISFTLEAQDIADLVSKMKGKAGTINMSGTIQSMSFN